LIAHKEKLQTERIFTMVPKIELGQNITAAVLVAGAGIEGMQAALDLADAGFKVYLADNQTPGCKSAAAAAARDLLCGISSKLLAVQENNNIELLENACVEGIEGAAGNFQVTLGSAVPSSVKGKTAPAEKKASEKPTGVAVGAVIFAPGFSSLTAAAGYDFQEELRALAERNGFSIPGKAAGAQEDMFPHATSRPGIFVTAGGAMSVMSDALVDGGSAAALAAELLSSVRGALAREKKYPAEKQVANEEPVIGIFACKQLLSGKKTATGTITAARKLASVVLAEELPNLCTPSALQRIQAAIADRGLNRVIAITCSPAAHEPLLQETLAEAALNRYLLEMPDREITKESLCMSIARTRMLEPLREVSTAVVQSGLVIGGGSSALTAALSLANQGFEVYLVEQGPGPKAEESLGLRKKIDAQGKIKLFPGARITGFAGHPGSYATTIEVKGAEKVLRHGTVIIEPGAEKKELAALLKIPLAAGGGFLQPDALLPLDLACRGMFCCSNAGDARHGIKTGLAAAARAATILAKRELVLSSVISVVDPERCVACLTCVRECPYHASAISEERVAFIEPADCRGCGICASACPRRAIELRHYTDEQILAELAAGADARS
jgi:heterodisulfide reductase subunit A-like polyferredoxin